MKKIVIVGISGVGKSTFARALHQRTGIPLFHLDSIIWNENWQEPSPQEVNDRLRGLVLRDQWIVEGWVGDYAREVLDVADVVLYLDYPGYLALWGGLMRWVQHRGRKRVELPEGCVEKLNWSFLKVMLFRKERVDIEKLLAKMEPKKVLRLKSRRACARMLREAKILGR